MEQFLVDIAADPVPARAHPGPEPFDRFIKLIRRDVKFVVSVPTVVVGFPGRMDLCRKKVQDAAWFQDAVQDKIQLLPGALRILLQKNQTACLICPDFFSVRCRAAQGKSLSRIVKIQHQLPVFSGIFFRHIS